MNLVIEKARPEDAREILDYLKIVGSETDNLSFGPEGLPYTVEDEAEFIRSATMYVARLDGRIIGDASLSIPTRPRICHRGELGISVLKEAWGRGIGSALLEKIIAVARDTKGLEIIHLEVRSDNHRAIHLYHKFGFQKNGTCPGMMKINGQLVDCDLMDLYL